MDILWSNEYVTRRDALTRSARESRVRAVEGAARAAVLTDRRFAPAHVRSSAARFFREVQAAWTDVDRTRLARLVVPELLEQWEVLFADYREKGWTNIVAVHEVDIEYVGLRNGGASGPDRVVVRMSAHTDDYVLDASGAVIPHNGNPSREAWLREYWTLAPEEDGWRLISIEQDEEGEHNLADPLVPLPPAPSTGP